MAVKSVIGKVLVEYVALVAVIIGMAAILVYERERIREIETESAEIRQLRRDINTAHRRITRLALLGEGVIGWDKADLLHYRLETPLSGVCAPGTDRHPAFPVGR